MICLALLLGFTLLGYSWTSTSRGGLLLAPTVGLATTVVLSYSLSSNFELTGADAVAAAILILLAVITFREWLLRKTFAQRYGFFYSDLIDVAFTLPPVVVLLVPALAIGMSDFFGVGNFDFFYNSQDGWFLSSNSVNQYMVEDHILPLTWSANPQGRFGIALLSSFAYKYAGLNTLHFNAELLSACVGMAAFLSYVFVQRVLMLRGTWGILSAGVFVLSAGYAQGYSYFLLGQISAMPLLLAMMVSIKPLLEDCNTPSQKKSQHLYRDALIVAFWLNALYIFYAVLAFFGIALFLLAAFIKVCRTGAWKAVLVRVGIVIAAVLILFLLVRALSLPSAVRIISDWILLSLKTAGTTAGGPQVFTEYLTEGFFALLLGWVRYPSAQSVFGSLLWFNGSQSVPLLIISSTAITSFLFATKCFFACRQVPQSGKTIMGALVLLSLVCGFAFFISGSGYALFKIASWFVPICLLAPLAALSERKQFGKTQRRILGVTGLSLLALNVITAISYVYVFLPFGETFGSGKEPKIVDMHDIENLSSLIPLEKHLKLDFLDGLKAAWFANEVRHRDVQAYSHNLQPLADRLVDRKAVCAVNPIISYSQSIVVTDHFLDGSEDIIQMAPSPKLKYSSGKYQAFDMDGLEFYVSLGRGTYPSHRLSESDVKNTGLPRTLRWVEEGFELYVYARKGGSVDLSLDVAPGFVKGPETRTLKLSGVGEERTTTFSKVSPQVRFDQLPVKAGMNCFYIESTDEVKNINRYGALFRDTITVDSRLLNFAVGNLSARLGN